MAPAPTSTSIRGKRIRRVAGLAGILLLIGLGYLAITNDPRVWPYRNTLQYYVFEWVWDWMPGGDARATGTLAGYVRDRAGNPIPNARVLVAESDGTSWSAETNAMGQYTIPSVPTAHYVPVAGAPGFADTAFRRGGIFRVGVEAGTTTQLNITLVPAVDPPLAPAEGWQLGPARAVTLEKPLPATAEERTISYTVAGRPNQTSLYYTPVGGSDTLPVILAVYPGPADMWAQVSLPLAQAGYAVIAVGPAYALDLEPDIDDLQRLLQVLNDGGFPRADPNRVGILGGSYSTLHVFRLMVRDPDAVDAALVLGPPADLFELRRQYEAGTFFPPFGLDQALIALGFPDRVPELYWRYSPRFHARNYNVPVMLIHSKADEVVPFTESEALAAEFARLGKPYELHILEGMGHYLLEPERTPAIDDLFNTTIEFLGEHLKD